MNMKLSNQGLSSREEFEIYIESIGFKYNYDSYFYECKEFKIDLYNLTDDHYDFFNGSKWFSDFTYNDLTPIEMYFKKELRSIKLKELLR